MEKIEIEEARKSALDFTAKMGSVFWTDEIESLKQIENKWIIKIKSTSFGNEIKIVNLEIDADTGKILSYEKS